MTAFEKLNNVFTEDFIMSHKDIDNIDDLYDAVVAVDPDIAREDYDVYIKTISDSMHNDTLDEKELETVTGGFAWATVAGVCALVTFCYKGGEAIGKGIYYMRHK